MKKNMIILCGTIASGKTTVAEYLSNTSNYKELSFANTLKKSLNAVLQEFGEICSINMFYDPQQKNNELTITLPYNLPSSIRGAMQWWGELIKKELGQDFWIKQLVNRIATIDRNIVVSDARFTYEIEALLNNTYISEKYNVTTINIFSNRSPRMDHISETHLNSYDIFDFILENNGTLAELYNNIESILQTISLKNK